MSLPALPAAPATQPLSDSGKLDFLDVYELSPEFVDDYEGAWRIRVYRGPNLQAVYVFGRDVRDVIDNAVNYVNAHRTSIPQARSLTTERADG